MKDIFFKISLVLGVIGIAVVPLLTVAKTDKVTICHATGSEKNPFVKITVSTEGWLNGHIQHEGDFILVGENCEEPLPD